MKNSHTVRFGLPWWCGYTGRHRPAQFGGPVLKNGDTLAQLGNLDILRRKPRTHFGNGLCHHGQISALARKYDSTIKLAVQSFGKICPSGPIASMSLRFAGYGSPI